MNSTTLPSVSPPLPLPYLSFYFSPPLPSPLLPFPPPSLQLEWSVDYTTLQQQQVLLSSLFVETRGRVIFSAGQTTASFSLALQPTNVSACILASIQREVK